MTSPATFSLALVNEPATAHLMADLALLTGPGDVITLSGDLGAGKTAAARAMIRYFAGDDELEVPSPTFTLAQIYDLPSFQLVHADLYRINDASELEEIGLSPLPEGTVARIDRAERAPGGRPAGAGKCAGRVERVKTLPQFREDAGYGEAKRVFMAGAAWIRSYARLVRDN